MHAWFGPRNVRLLAGVLLAAMAVVQTGCGTLIHPERRGQTTGRIDPAIAILNGIGLLFFIIPGLIAFAVDFSTGAIYLPPEETNGDDGQIIRLDPDEMTPERIAAAISEQTGRDVSAGDVRSALEQSSTSSSSSNTWQMR